MLWLALISTQITADVAGVEQGLEHLGIGHGGTCNGQLAYQLIAFGEANVEVVAEIALVVLFLGPFGAYIFLRPVVGGPVRRYSALLEHLGFFALVAMIRARTSVASIICPRRAKLP